MDSCLKPLGRSGLVRSLIVASSGFAGGMPSISLPRKRRDEAAHPRAGVRLSRRAPPPNEDYSPVRHN